MTTFQTADDLLDFAIAREEEAAAFYTEQAEKMNRPETRKVFLGFAAEEKEHKAKLQAIKSGVLRLQLPPQKITNLRIADYMKSAPPVGPYMTYADMLTVAMLKEKEAFKLYTDLSAATDNAELRTIFDSLAAEEAKHKLRFEMEYDLEMFGEN